MNYRVELLNFEGPLDLLLQLIERSEVEVTQISLGDVTEQYLHYIDQLQPLEAAELHWFLDLATKLLYIKSAALLPGSLTDETQEDIAELQARLAEYKHYQKGSLFLQDLIAAGGRSHTRDTKPQVPAAAIPPLKVNVESLRQAFTEAADRLPQKPDESAVAEVVSLEEMMARIQEIVAPYEQVSLQQVLGLARSRLEIVVTFLALLELIKAKLVSVCQDKQFGDIIVINEGI